MQDYITDMKPIFKGGLILKISAEKLKTNLIFYLNGYHMASKKLSILPIKDK